MCLCLFPAWSFLCATQNPALIDIGGLGGAQDEVLGCTPPGGPERFRRASSLDQLGSLFNLALTEVFPSQIMTQQPRALPLNLVRCIYIRYGTAIRTALADEKCYVYIIMRGWFLNDAW